MNIKNIRNKAYVMAHGINRKKLYKSGKLWLVGSATLLALMGGANAISHQSVHAANVDQPNVTAHAKTSQIKANPQASNSAYTVKSSTPSSVASQSNNNNSNNFQIKSIATNNVGNSNIQSSANDLHSKLLNSKVASALTNSNSGENSAKIFSNEPSNLKISSNKLGSASNSDNNASTPNYIEDNAHYNLGSYNSRQPQSTEAQKEAYANYLKQNPQLANLYNETVNQSSSNNVAGSHVASNAPKDNVSASNIASNSSASSVSANNSKVSSANQISDDKKNKPLMKLGVERNLTVPSNIQTGTYDGLNYQYDPSTQTVNFVSGTLKQWDPNNTNTSFIGNDDSKPNATLHKAKNIIFSNNIKMDPSFNNSNLTEMFNGNPTVQYIKLSSAFNTVKPKYVWSNFSVDNSLQEVDLTGLNTSQATDWGQMFGYDPNLRHIIGLNTLDTSNNNVFTNLFLNDPNLQDIDLSNFDTSTAQHSINGYHQNGIANMIVGDSGLKTIKLGPKSVLTNLTINGDPAWSYAQNVNSGVPFGEDLIQLADGQAHPGTWQVFHGKGGQYSNNSGSALWALNNNGTLYLENGALDVPASQSNFHDWSKVKKIVYHNISGGNNANLPQQMNDIVGDKNKIAHVKDNGFINQDSAANSAVNNDINIINSADSYIENHGTDGGNSAVAHAENADNDANNAFSDIQAQSANATANAISTLASEVNTDNKTINSDNGKISSLNNSLVAETTRASDAVASASQSATQSVATASYNASISASDAEKNAIGSAKTSIASESASMVVSVNAASSSASQSVSSLANSLSASLSAASSALNWIKSSGNSAYNNASNGSAQATSNSGWINSNSSSLSQASNEASEASGSAKTNATNISNIQAELSNYNTVSLDATKAISSLASEDTRINSNVASNSSQSAWISSAKGTLSTLSGDVKNIQDNTADNTAIASLSSAVKTASNIASEASASAIANQNWIHSNSASLSSASTEANQASTSAKTNATNISNLSGKVKTDENSLASASTSASSVAKWLTSDSATLSSASESAYSAYNYYTTNSASISNAIQEASNVSLAQSSFNTAYTNASKAESWINNNSGSFSALSNSISSLSGTVDGDKQALNNAIATKANASDISGDINILNNDIAKNNSLVNQANKLANDNSNAINNLKANTAITLTFIKDGKLFGTPTTLTNSYIEQNATPETGTTQGQPGTYNVTSLLENSLPSGYNISNAYTVTIGSHENGTATMNLGNGDKKFALGATRDNSNNMNVLTLGTPSQQARAWNYVQKGINHNDFAPLSKVGTNYPYTSNTDKAKNNPIDVSGNPVRYSGNITLNFVDNNNHQIKSITVPYNVNSAVGNTVNLLENATNGNPNVSDATKYLDQTIQGFDTHNFSYDSGNQQKDYSFEIPVSDNSGHTTTVAKKNRDLTFTFKANNETETINYIDEATNKNVGTGSVSGADDTQGVVTSKNANNLPKDYQIINNAPFTFTQNGSVNVLVAKKGTENKDNSNDTHSNVPNAKPTKPSDVAHTFTVTVNDHYNSDGKQQTKTYQKYVVEKGAEGSKFTVNPSDYTTYGYNMNTSDKPVTGTITNNGLSTNGITWSFTAKKASSDNNSSNYKPSDVTPNNVTPSDLTKNPSANNPQNKNNVDNAKHGYATLYLVERINGQNHNVTVRTINENNLDTTANYDIKASDYTPTGYKTTSSDNDLTGHIKTDGSLSNGTATFYYDVNVSDIAPISITDINQDGDYVNANTGSDLGKSDTNNEATYTIGSKYLSTLGALGDYVNITNLLQAPNGYHLNNVNNAVSTNGTALNHIQLTKPTGVSLSNPLGAMKFVLTLPSRYTPKQEMTSEASEVQSDVGSATNWANNTSLSDSTRKSINSDIHSMNDDNVAIRQHITGGTNGSKAAKPFYSNASSAYANASAMANSGILSASTKARSQAESADAMNAKSASASSANPISNLVITGSTGAKSQSNSANHQRSNSQWIPRNPISDKSRHSLKNVSRKGLINLRFGTLAKYNGYKVSRISLKGIRYFKVYKPILLHTDPMSVGRARNYKGRITPRMRLTLTITKAFKLVRNHHTYYRFLLSFNHHDYFITANSKFVRNSYLRSVKHANYKVKVIKPIRIYKHFDSHVIGKLHKGDVVNVKRIVKWGRYNRTHIQLTNGHWITSNLNCVERF